MRPKRVTIEDYNELMARIGGINAAFVEIHKPAYHPCVDPKGREVGVYTGSDGRWVVEEIE